MYSMYVYIWHNIRNLLRLCYTRDRAIKYNQINLMKVWNYCVNWKNIQKLPHLTKPFATSTADENFFKLKDIVEYPIHVVPFLRILDFLQNVSCRWVNTGLPRSESEMYGRFVYKYECGSPKL